jgi:hypothetical protein
MNAAYNIPASATRGSWLKKVEKSNQHANKNLKGNSTKHGLQRPAERYRHPRTA